MSKAKFILEIILLLAVIAGVLGYKFLRSEEYKVKKQLLAICDDVCKNSKEGNTTTAIKVVAMGNRLAPHVSIAIHGVPVKGGMSGEELVGHASRARMYLDKLNVTVVDQEITVDGDNATIDCVIHATAVGKDSYYSDDNYHLDITLTKDKNGTWLFTAFKENDLLKK